MAKSFINSVSKFREPIEDERADTLKSRSELPWFFRLMSPMGIPYLFTKKMTLVTFPLWGKTHGYESPEEQALFMDMVRQQTDYYLQWALRALSTWQGIDNPGAPIIQIHGAQDKTFPVKLLKQPDEVVDGAGHFMVYKKAQKVSDLILRQLESL